MRRVECSDGVDQLACGNNDQTFTCVCELLGSGVKTDESCVVEDKVEGVCVSCATWRGGREIVDVRMRATVVLLWASVLNIYRL